MAVSWNRNKKRYDLVLWAGIISFLIIFSLLQHFLDPAITAETLIIRSTALCAFIMLHIVLVIGPLCRIDNRFLPLLYNRRHLGVSTFLIAAIHGLFLLLQYHGLSETPIFHSLFFSNGNYSSLIQFPFMTLGFGALVILFLLAATSHDFWLENLGPRLWKSLHMMVYAAYALLVAHVLLGFLQQEQNVWLLFLLILGVATVSGLHLWSAIISSRKTAKADSNWVYACELDQIDENQAFILRHKRGEIAIFKYDQKLSAVENRCKHQMGPLGEGKIIDGCITCPWHGFQYHPANGQSPPPFEEKINTYKLRLSGSVVEVHTIPEGEGVQVEPIKLG